MSQRKTTITDVANAAQVSVATVDRVLNGRGGVKPERARRVLEWARKLKIDRALEDLPMRWLRIAVLLQNPNNPYHGSLKTGFQLAQRAYEAQRIMCLPTYFDSLEPAAVARTIRRAAERADGLVTCIYDHPRITAALKEVSRKVPVVTIASDLPASGRLAYVGSDNRVAGRVAGELMGRFLGPQGGQVMVVTGMHDYIGHEERESGFRAVLASRFPACEVVATAESQEQPERTEKLTRDALKRFPDLRGIYNISVGSRGIANALSALGRGGKVALISHEMHDIHRELLTDGLMDAVLDQNPQMEALRAIQLLLHYNRRVPDTEVPLETPVAIYLRENLPTV
ncbi:MAG: LacI family DNA-binding transcriptional regulator [Rhodospirillaceae bacterium]|jgi:LacI family transcriptional regulator|nr:LacI family DNA-binding transcriptional regulator [Rhodospirillaceae bacterium]